MPAANDTLLNQLKLEIFQRGYEGFLVSDEIRDEVRAIDPKVDAFNDGKILPIRKKLEDLPADPSFTYVQPSDLEGIRGERPDGPRQLTLSLGSDELLDRFHGAWAGRAAGCTLGKPVEMLGMLGFGGKNGRAGIKSYLENRGDWPLNDYFSGRDVDDGMSLPFPETHRENISYMMPDDDIHYTLIGLKVMEFAGRDFTWQDVAQAWNSSIPYSAMFTAESQAMLNFNIKTPKMPGVGHFPTPEFTRTNNNPYREWIGAQIRADFWGYAAAGNPELAAEFAFRDAHWTHTANGIYGEMFIAALIAAAFVESDPSRLVEIGLSEIPKNCRLSEAIDRALSWVKECSDFESFMDKLEEDYGRLSPVHTVNNALIVVMSLFFGNMDPVPSTCLAVMGGLDTDCNGATAGSITGAALGLSAMDKRLVSRLNDIVKPAVIGFQEITMAELAKRTLEVHSRVMGS